MTRIIAAHPADGVHQRMLAHALRQVFTTDEDGRFDDLVRQLDLVTRQEPRPHP